MERKLTTAKEVPGHDELSESVLSRNSGASVADQPLPPEATGIPEPITVSKALSPQRVNMNLQSADRDGVLRELVALVIDPKDQHCVGGSKL